MAPRSLNALIATVLAVAGVYAGPCKPSLASSSIISFSSTFTTIEVLSSTETQTTSGVLSSTETLSTADADACASDCRCKSFDSYGTSCDLYSGTQAQVNPPAFYLGPYFFDLAGCFECDD